MCMINIGGSKAVHTLIRRVGIARKAVYVICGRAGLTAHSLMAYMLDRIRSRGTFIPIRQFCRRILAPRLSVMIFLYLFGDQWGCFGSNIDAQVFNTNIMGGRMNKMSMTMKLSNQTAVPSFQVGYLVKPSNTEERIGRRKCFP